jgi:hypothetical protein
MNYTLETTLSYNKFGKLNYLTTAILKKPKNSDSTCKNTWTTMKSKEYTSL